MPCDHFRLARFTVAGEKHDPCILRQFRPDAGPAEAHRSVDAVRVRPVGFIPRQLFRYPGLFRSAKPPVHPFRSFHWIEVGPQLRARSWGEQLYRGLVEGAARLWIIRIAPEHRVLGAADKRIETVDDHAIEVKAEDAIGLEDIPEIRFAQHQPDKTRPRHMLGRVKLRGLNEVDQVRPMRDADPPVRDSEMPRHHPIPDAHVLGREGVRTAARTVAPEEAYDRQHQFAAAITGRETSSSSAATSRAASTQVPIFPENTLIT